jgi:hypothetical protein
MFPELEWNTEAVPINAENIEEALDQYMFLDPVEFTVACENSNDDEVMDERSKLCEEVAERVVD